MVPWSVLTPAQVETIVGVLLGRELPRSVRIRPGQGDGGIDVLDQIDAGSADVYQIKSFSTALTPARKRQIKQSLERVAANNSVSVRDWYLVIPLNPSPGDLEWLASLAADFSFNCRWYDLGRLEGLAAAYQDVVDYYVGDGRQRLEASIERLRALAGLMPTDSGLLVSPSESTEPLAALHELLNRDDPHYSYDFEVGRNPPDRDSVMNRSGLVASFTRRSGDTAVTFHIHARYRMATEDRPIPLTFAVQADLMDDELRAAWERALRYGTPVTLPTPIVTDLSFGLPGGLDATAAEGTLWIGAAHPDHARPYRLRLRLVDEETRLVAETLLEMEPLTRGMDGRGWRAHGSAPAGGFRLELTGEVDEEGVLGTVTFGVTVGQLDRVPPAALRPSIHFLAALHHPNQLQFAPEYGPPAKQSMPLTNFEAPVTDELVELIGCLADLQDMFSADLRTPNLEELTPKSLQEILRAGQLARGESLHLTWKEQHLTLDAEPNDADMSGPVQLALGGNYTVNIGGQEVTIEPVTIVLLAANLVRDEDEQGVALRATPALDNDTMLIHAKAIDQVSPQPLGTFGEGGSA